MNSESYTWEVPRRELIVGTKEYKRFKYWLWYEKKVLNTRMRVTSLKPAVLNELLIEYHEKVGT